MKKPEKILHNHNSIPGYFDGEDEGCSVCIRNRACENWEKWFKPLSIQCSKHGGIPTGYCTTCDALQGDEE